MRLFRLTVLVPLALLAVAFLLSLAAWVASMVPGWLSAVAFAVLGIFALWFVLARRNGPAGGSEYSFLRSTSKDGLL